MINSYFYDLLESYMGNRTRRLSTCAFIFHVHAGAHRFTVPPNACLTGAI